MATMNQATAQSRVAVFVDFRNMVHSLEDNFENAPATKELAEAILVVARELGQVVLARAYADWTSDQSGAQAVQASGFDPILVIRKLTGRDRSDMTMALDAYDMKDREDVEVCVICTGDADFRDPVRRLKLRGKRIVICAVSATTTSELLSEANPFIPIEGRLNLQPISQATADVRRFEELIRKLDSLENTLPFVGLTHFRDKHITQSMCGGDTASMRQRYVNEAINEGIMHTYDVPNPNNPNHPTAAIKLNRNHAVVKNALSGQGDKT